MRQSPLLAFVAALAVTAVSAAGQASPPPTPPSLVLSSNGSALPPKPLANFVKDGKTLVTDLDPAAIDLWKVSEESELTLALTHTTGTYALVVLAYNKPAAKSGVLQVCQTLPFQAANPVTLKLKDFECQDGDFLQYGGLLALGNGVKYIPIVGLTDVKAPWTGGDLGVALAD
ncbi:MAG: hypothetical protein KDD47_23720, partial [Acidobacteria bacterium]|nr:hypothetical protein [Acidobacteriota bacterium]